MAINTTSLTVHAPTPRPANSFMLNALSTLRNASVQASQPPKPSTAPSTTRTRANLSRFDTRQLLRDKVATVINRRIEASKNTISFPSSPRRALGRRSDLTTAPRVPLSPTVALHNAERRISLIPIREIVFRARPRPAARGKRIISKVPTLREHEVYPPLPVPQAVHPMGRTKANGPRQRQRRPVTDENTIPFPTGTPALRLPSALPKARRTARAASYSLPRAPFGQLAVE